MTGLQHCPHKDLDGMKGKRISLSSLVSCFVFIPIPVCAAVIEVAPQTQEISLLPAKIALVAGLAISIYGLYASRKKKIVVFANLTDIFATVAIPIVAFLSVFLTMFLEMKGILAEFVIVAGVCGMAAVVAKATFSYNASIKSGIWGFLLALFTKFYLLTIYVFIVLLIFLNGNKRKGESENSFRRRIRRENTAYFLGTTTFFGILAYLGLWDRNFVSMRDYINGEWGVNEPA